MVGRTRPVKGLSRSMGSIDFIAMLFTDRPSTQREIKRNMSKQPWCRIEGPLWELFNNCGFFQGADPAEAKIAKIIFVGKDAIFPKKWARNSPPEDYRSYRKHFDGWIADHANDDSFRHHPLFPLDTDKQRGQRQDGASYHKTIKKVLMEAAKVLANTTGQTPADAWRTVALSTSFVELFGFPTVSGKERVSAQSKWIPADPTDEYNRDHLTKLAEWLKNPKALVFMAYGVCTEIHAMNANQANQQGQGLAGSVKDLWSGERKRIIPIRHPSLYFSKWEINAIANMIANHLRK